MGSGFTPARAKILIVHPGLLFLVGLGGGLGLQHLHPLPLPFLPPFLRLGLAAALILAGTILVAWSLASFTRAKISPEPGDTPTVLLVRGPYRFSRNPLYLANPGVLAGMGLGLECGWILGAAALVWTLLALVVVPREERLLRATFGADYEAYCARVRRWL